MLNLFQHPSCTNRKLEGRARRTVKEVVANPLWACSARSGIFDPAVRRDWKLRVVLYGLLSKLPARVFAGGGQAASIGASLYPDAVKTWLGNNVTPEHIRMIAIICAVVFALYWAILLWLKPKPAIEASNGQSFSSATRGALSPAINTIRGDANFHYGLAHAIEEPKKPQSLSYDVAKLTSGLERSLLPSFEKPKPDLPLTGLLIRVYARHRPMPNDNIGKGKLWIKIDQEIADAVVENELHSWGRTSPGRARRPIDVSDWQHGNFNHRDKTLGVAGLYSDGFKLTDLCFCEAEIERIWPMA